MLVAGLLSLTTLIFLKAENSRITSDFDNSTSLLVLIISLTKSLWSLNSLLEVSVVKSKMDFSVYPPVFDAYSAQRICPHPALRDIEQQY